ncbi:DoxX family protein [Mucilaginibacter sp. HMF5004]|uniref:DoxX family protein n=1 Tax=Mucilaginibacter rivuli TaxID=2857527 RepID=UPI001C5E2301|nr:DoxX family protein [Mucilaginibacter rivuli]MBW4890974.1 DoxX family protein [Mucilaginibacter rivuli]
MIKKTGLVILVLFYLLAGMNHFRMPGTYVRIIPSYLPNPALLNILSGICEIVFAVLYIFPATRQLAAWGIMAMLIAFLPVHIDMILHAPVMLGNFKVTPLIAWLRIPLQALFILWAWWCSTPD